VQDVITLKGALKLIEWLPGEPAKIYRGQVVEILTRRRKPSFFTSKIFIPEKNGQ
jgi:hypothetical protein